MKFKVFWPLVGRSLLLGCSHQYLSSGPASAAACAFPVSVDIGMSARETVCAVLLFQQIREMFHSSFWKIDSSAGLEDSSHNNSLHVCNNCLYILNTKQCSLGSKKNIW